MDKCEKCGKEVERSITWLLYPTGTYPKEEGRLLVCGHCLPENVKRVSPFAFEEVANG